MWMIIHSWKDNGVAEVIGPFEERFEAEDGMGRIWEHCDDNESRLDIIKVASPDAWLTDMGACECNQL